MSDQPDRDNSHEQRYSRDNRDGGYGSYNSGDRFQRRDGGYGRDDYGERRGGYYDRRGGYDRRDGGYGDRGSYGDRRGGYGDRRGGYERRGPAPERKPKWTEEEVQQLKELVEKQKSENPEGKVDWEQIGQQMNGRYASTCFNKYTQISEKEWTKEEEDKLLDFWKDNKSKFETDEFDIMTVVKELEGHTKRGVQFKLERLTQEAHEDRPYRMGRDEMQKTE